MTIAQLKYFLAVAENKSFSKVAEKYFVSQPAVSKEIATLEEELGATLFLRKTQGIELTKIGKELEQIVSEFFASIKELKDNSRNTGEIISGNYYLGCLNGWDISSFFPGLFDYVKSKYPEVNLHIAGFDINQIMYALKRGEADGVIASSSLFAEVAEINLIPLTEVDAILVYPASVSKETEDITLSDFKDFKFFATAPRGMMNWVTDITSPCEAAGFYPTVEHATSLADAYMKIQAGQGVMMLNSLVMSKDNPAFKQLNLGIKRQVGLVTLASRKTYLNEAISECIKEYFGIINL